METKNEFKVEDLSYKGSSSDESSPQRFMIFGHSNEEKLQIFEVSAEYTQKEKFWLTSNRIGLSAEFQMSDESLEFVDFKDQFRLRQEISDLGLELKTVKLTVLGIVNKIRENENRKENERIW